MESFGYILTGDLDHVEIEVGYWRSTVSRMVGIMGMSLMLMHFINSFENTLSSISYLELRPFLPTQNSAFHMKHFESHM